MRDKKIQRRKWMPLLGLGLVAGVIVVGWHLWAQNQESSHQPAQTETQGEVPPQIAALPLEPNVPKEFKSTDRATSFTEVDLSAWSKRLRYERGGMREWYASLSQKVRVGTIGRDTILEAYAYLDSNFYEQGEMQLLNLNALKNQLLDQLMQLKPLPSDLGNRLMAMYKDSRQDPVWRDYCVQHFASYYAAKWPESTLAKDNDEATRILVNLRQAADEPEGAIAGSALIGLEWLSREHKECDREQVGNLALSMAMDKSRPLHIRATAMQVCGMMGKKEAISTARILLGQSQDESCVIPALGVLGTLGNDSDLALLQSLADHASSPYIRNAAQAALQRLIVRLSLPSSS
jgi:hypothetical protein